MDKTLQSPEHEELIQNVKSIVKVISHGQAEHCGYHHFIFKTEDQSIVKHICYAVTGDKTTIRPTGYMSILLDHSELEYFVSIANDRSLQDFINLLNRYGRSDETNST